MGFRIGKSGTPVNTGLADRLPGNPRKHWAGGQPLRKRPFYAGFGAGRQRQYRAGASLPAAAERNDLPAYTPRLLGVPAEPLLHPLSIGRLPAGRQRLYRLYGEAPIHAGYFWDGSWRSLWRDGGGWFSGCMHAVLRVLRGREGFFAFKVFSSWEPYSVRVTKIFSMNFAQLPARFAFFRFFKMMDRAVACPPPETAAIRGIERGVAYGAIGRSRWRKAKKRDKGRMGRRKTAAQAVRLSVRREELLDPVYP